VQKHTSSLLESSLNLESFFVITKIQHIIESIDVIRHIITPHKFWRDMVYVVATLLTTHTYFSSILLFLALALAFSLSHTCKYTFVCAHTHTNSIFWREMVYVVANLADALVMTHIHTLSFSLARALSLTHANAHTCAHDYPANSGGNWCM